MSNKTTVRPGNFDEFRQQQFDEIAQDKGTMFNFFYINNEVFQMIHEDDVQRVNNAYLTYMNRMSSLVIGTYGAIIFVNNFLLRGKPKYPNFRFSIFCGKWIVLPFVTYGVSQKFLVMDQKETLRQMAEKYNFGYNDYNRAMDLFERAYRVGKLEDLIQQGKQFDWTGIPEFKSKYYLD